MSSKTIVILYGGHPDESEISRQSGINVLNACIEINLHPILININRVELKPLLESILHPIIINLVHGRWGEDGSAQIMFEEMGIPYFGSSVFASETLFNKIKFRELAGKFVKIPKGKIMNKDEYLKTWTEYPHILKPYDSGSSIGVQYVENKNEIDFDKWIDNKIVEEYIDGIEGVSLVYNGKIVGGSIVNYNGKIFDYKTKYDPKLSKLEHWDSLDIKIRNEIGSMSELLYKECECSGFVCIDFKINSRGEIYIIEGNTIPGMTKCSLVPYIFKAQKNIDFNTLVNMMVQDAETRLHTDYHSEGVINHMNFSA